MRILKTKLNECLCAVKPDITVSLLRRDINVINQMTDGSVKMGEIHFDRIHIVTLIFPGYLPGLIPILNVTG